MAHTTVARAVALDVEKMPIDARLEWMADDGMLWHEGAMRNPLPMVRPMGKQVRTFVNRTKDL